MIKKFIMFAIAGILLSNCAFASDCEIVRKSVRFYENQVKENPNDVCSLYNLANEYLLKYKVQKSLDTYDQIIKINPKENRAYVQRAYIYMNFNNPGLAEREYGRLVKNIPDSLYGNIMMAITYENISDYENAIKYASRAIELAENNISDYNPNDDLKLIKWSQKIESQENEYKTFYYFRADYYQKMGMYKEAIKDYTTYAESKLEDSYLVYILIRDCYKALGDLNNAEKALQKFNEESEKAPKSSFKLSITDRIKIKYFGFRTMFYINKLT